MPSTIREVVDRLAPTEIVPRADLDALVRDEFGNQHDADSTVFAAQLVDRGWVSPFQAERLQRNETIVIDDYVLLEQRGAGGMARVYKARHRKMNRIVALKLIREPAATSRQAVGRFLREIKAVAALDHPDIVRAYDAGEVDGIHYLAMEYVEGQDLAHSVRENGALCVERAIDYVIQAAESLAYVHQQGIIHRDVKPSNLMLTPEGRIRVLDLGLARLRHPAELAVDDLTDVVTEMGDMLGTAAYMAPEQSENPRAVDHRCDIYSLGCTLYFLLTGKTVYGGSSYVEKVLAHRQAPPPLLKVDSGRISAELQAVFRKMVSKDPAQRYQTMEEAAEALRRARVVQASPGLAADSATKRSRSPRSIAAVTLGAAVIAIISVIAGRGREQAGPDDGAPDIAQEEGGQVRPDHGLASHGATSESESGPPQRSGTHSLAAALIQRGGTLDVLAEGEGHAGIDSADGLPDTEFDILRVTLAGTQFGDSDLAFVAQTPELEYLNLAGTHVTSRGIAFLTAASSLRTLYLSNTAIDNAALPTIAALPRLEELDLRGTRVEDEGIAHLLECRSLRTLRLGEGQPLTEGVVQSISRISWLKSLGLRDVPVRNESIKHLQKLEGLEWLDLGSTEITGDSSPSLMEMPHLLQLYLDGNQFTMGEIEKLRRSLPGCEISF